LIKEQGAKFDKLRDSLLIKVRGYSELQSFVKEMRETIRRYHDTQNSAIQNQFDDVGP